MTTIPAWFIPLSILIGSILTVTSMDYNDAQVEHNHYCEMVQLWEANKHLPPDQRPGWPPYKGKEMCDGA